MVKKYIMIGVKSMVGCIPESIRNKVKRWPWLTSLYSRNLQKSGLSYGIPSKKKTAKLYEGLISKQNMSLKGMTLGIPFNVVVVVNGNSSLLNFTLEYLADINTIETVFLLVKGEENVNYNLNNLTANLEVVSESSLDFSCDAEREINNFLVINAGDALHPLIEGAVSAFLNSSSSIGYFDSDSITSSGKRHSPKLHSDWNPDLLLSTGYINTGLWFRSNRVFAKQARLEVSQTSIADFLASIYLDELDMIVGHLPYVVVHSQAAADKNSFPLGPTTINKVAKYAKVTKHAQYPILKLLWHTETSPLVSLIIPTRNSRQLVKVCVESILTKTTYRNFEILLVDNQSDEQESLDYFNELNKHPQIKVLKYDQKFNYSAINNFAVTHASGEIIGLINNDIEVIEPEWLSYMVNQVNRKEIGCVGAKLLYPDGRIQHAGVVMGYGGGAGHAHKYFPREHSGYLNRLAATNCFSAVTAACLLVKKSDYLAVNGLDEINLEVAFNDVDFCLKVLSLGRRNLYCAEAILFHYESVSRGFDDTVEKRDRFEKELNYLQKNWASIIEHDPAYSPNLTLRRENFSIKEC
ncbi:glycosyltransferase [Alteromonas sp. M12]|uniref:glycosyltransferase family 2 protein n=1 Tax=Alteromonas sp. M12 TaxID=3135644 RepID=UPI00319DBABE